MYPTSSSLTFNKPSGTLGPPVVKHLCTSGFQVTLLTRDPSKLPASKFPTNIKVVKVDYTSVETLTPFLSGYDAVVDLTNRTATEIQLRVIDAAIAAQMPHIIPSSYGVGTKNPGIRSFPHVAGKRKMEDYILHKAEEGALTFTGIQTGIFLELALRNSGIINTKDDGPTTLFDGGDKRLSSTSIDSIGKAVAAALMKPEETKNRFLYVQNTVLTQNKLLRLAKELAPERQWQGVFKDTEEMYRASLEAWEKGDTSPMASVGFFVRASFGEELGIFDHVDNSLLGIEEYSDEELKGILARFI